MGYELKIGSGNAQIKHLNYNSPKLVQFRALVWYDSDLGSNDPGQMTWLLVFSYSMLAWCVGMKPTNIHWITMAWLHPLQRAFLGPALIQQDAFMNFLKSCDKANGRVESTRHGCTCYQLLGENGCLACNIGCQFWNANKAKHIIH